MMNSYLNSDILLLLSQVVVLWADLRCITLDNWIKDEPGMSWMENFYLNSEAVSQMSWEEKPETERK